MKSMFDKETYAEMVKRIEAMRHDSPRQWGKMTQDQVMHHCVHATKLAVGEAKLKRSLLGRILGPIAKKGFLEDKPFRQSLPTASELVVVSNKYDFEKEKAELLRLVKKLHEGGEAGTTKHPHGFFGELTPQQWAESQWKHLDHHLRQFGC
jgi:hypothetical protein